MNHHDAPRDEGLAAFERQARAAHARALEALSPRTRAQLHNRLQAALARGRPAPRRDWRWIAAPALALALALWLPRPGVEDPGVDPALVAAAATGALASPVAALEQDPEFYAWLGSDDASALAME